VHWIRQTLRSRDAYDSSGRVVLFGYSGRSCVRLGGVYAVVGLGAAAAGDTEATVSSMIEPKYQVCAAVSATMVRVPCGQGCPSPFASVFVLCVAGGRTKRVSAHLAVGQPHH
jgi:hypothetical protein